MRQIVKAPSLRQAKNGLVDVGNRIDVGDDHWEDGVTFTPRGCQTIFAHVPWCPGEDKSPFHDCVPPVVADAYLLEVGLVWSMVDLGADPKDIIEQAMEVGTSPVLERLAWAGVADTASGSAITIPPVSTSISVGGVTGRLMGGAVQPPTLTGDAVDIGDFGTTDEAVGNVEAKLLDASDHIGGGGTILMSPTLAARAPGSIDYINGKLVTKATQSPVIVGNFGASGPDEKVIGVSGDIDVYLGPVIIIEAQERSLNEWVGRAERRAVAVWNSCIVVAATANVA